MMYRVRLGASSAPRVALALSLLAPLLQALFSWPAAAADPIARPSHTIPAPVKAARVLPAQVSAVYRISFGLLGDIGAFRFNSNIDGEAYALTADAKIDTAVFDYFGAMTSSGSVHSAVAKPAAISSATSRRRFSERRRSGRSTWRSTPRA